MYLLGKYDIRQLGCVVLVSATGSGVGEQRLVYTACWNEMRPSFVVNANCS